MFTISDSFDQFRAFHFFFPIDNNRLLLRIERQKERLNVLSQWAFLPSAPARAPPVSPSESLLSAITHSASFIRPHLLLFSLLPPVSLFSSNSPDCIALSLSLRLCYPTQSVSSPPVFLPPNLLFVPRRLRRCLVMFFFLRSHFRTSEGDQEKIGLRKNLQLKAAAAPVRSPHRSAPTSGRDVQTSPQPPRNKLLAVALVSAPAL